MPKMYRIFLTLIFICFTFAQIAEAQKNRKIVPIKKPVPKQQPQPSEKNPDVGVVVDERLSLLRDEPGFYGKVIQRMRTGRVVSITASKEVEGITFYKVLLPPEGFGWVQAQAVIGKYRRGDEERLLALIQASEGFEQIERAMIYYDNFTKSPLRPPILLLLGDLIEEAAIKISEEATKKLDNREMAASGAPLRSFYLSYNGLDRYKRLGIRFLFNFNTKTFHYEGAAWKEIVEKFPKSAEVEEAQKRLDSLKEKMAMPKPADQ